MVIIAAASSDHIFSATSVRNGPKLLEMSRHITHAGRRHLYRTPGHTTGDKLREWSTISLNEEIADCVIILKTSSLKFLPTQPPVGVSQMGLCYVLGVASDRRLNVSPQDGNK